MEAGEGVGQWGRAQQWRSRRLPTAAVIASRLASEVGVKWTPSGLSGSALTPALGGNAERGIDQNDTGRKNSLRMGIEAKI